MISEQLMALGEWELTLEPDTPFEVREKIIGFSEIVIMPGHVSAEDMDDSLLEHALYRGTVTRPGPKATIGGHGSAFWLGTGDRYYTTQLTGVDLPYLSYIDGTGSNLSTWAVIVCSETPITLGTVTDPTGGSRTIAQSIQWISHRELLDSLAKIWDVEWRIDRTNTLDIGPYTTLWGNPTVVITPNAAGREIGRIGIEALVDSQQDLWGYASQVYLMGEGSLAHAGTYSAFYAPDGKRLWVTAVVDGADVSLTATSFAASRLITRLNDPTKRHSIKVSTDLLNISGSVEPGSRVYIWEPTQGIRDTSFNNRVEWRGETIYPWTFRVLSSRWPIQEGMGVLVRRYTGDVTVDLTGDQEWVDLTDYVQWEAPGGELEIAYDVPITWKV